MSNACINSLITQLRQLNTVPVESPATVSNITQAWLTHTVFWMAINIADPSQETLEAGLEALLRDLHEAAPGVIRETLASIKAASQETLQ